MQWLDSVNWKSTVQSSGRHFADLMIWVYLSPLEDKKIKIKIFLLITFILWWNISDGIGLFQDENVPIHRAWGFTEWFDEYENYINNMLCPSQSPDLNPFEQLWETLEWCVRQCSSTPTPTPTEWMSFQKNCVHPPVQFYRVSESTLLRHF